MTLLLSAALQDKGFQPTPWLQTPGRYSCTASLAASPATTAWLRCTSMGDSLVVYASLDAGSIVRRIALPFAAVAAADPRLLWNAVLDELVSPLQADAAAAAGLPLPASLLTLPEPLRAVLLGCLPAPSLAALAATGSRELRAAASDETLWRALYESEFTARVPGEEAACGAGAAALAARRGHRAAYAAAAAERTRARRREAMAAEMRRRRPRPQFAPAPLGPMFPGFGPAPPPPGFAPGILGGDFDRLPGGLGFGFGPGSGRGGMGGLPRHPGLG